MSTTPRTDAARGFYDMDTAVSAEDMEQLETELAAAIQISAKYENRYFETLTKLAEAKADAEDQAKWALEYLTRAEKAEAELAAEREKVRVLREALDCMIIGASAVGVSHKGELEVLQMAVDMARAALAATKEASK